MANAPDRATINRWYDHRMYRPAIEEFYDGSDFANLGYWSKGTSDARQASENLVEHIIDLLPAKAGTILDVACGKGATTRTIARHFRPQSITGINISLKQLQRAHENAPGCNFALMDATRLAFPDGCLDNVICVEAACHFNTRRKFFREAYRVLKPTGWLILSDLLIPAQAAPLARRIPAENILPGPERYAAVCRDAGFRSVTVIDTTHQCLNAFVAHALDFFKTRSSSSALSHPTAIDPLNQPESPRWLQRVSPGSFWVHLISEEVSDWHYVLAAASKS